MDDIDNQFLNLYRNLSDEGRLIITYLVYLCSTGQIDANELSRIIEDRYRKNGSRVISIGKDWLDNDIAKGFYQPGEKKI